VKIGLCAKYFAASRLLREKLLAKTQRRKEGAEKQQDNFTYKSLAFPPINTTDGITARLFYYHRDRGAHGGVYEMESHYCGFALNPCDFAPLREKTLRQESLRD